MEMLYRFFIRLLITGMRIGAVFNYKLKKGLAGRRQSCDLVREGFSAEDRIIWMHAASLGEYEQGLPVLEKLKSQFPQHKILITFFSPSGYDHVITKKHPADVICYLPFDTDKWVGEFISCFKTDIFFTVKYDFWYHLLSHLKAQGTKVYVVSALFYETQIFFSVYGKWFVKQLRENVDYFFHQTKHSTALAKGIGLKQSRTSGDTRFDRVRELRQRDTEVPHISDFKQDSKLLVFGSAWESEERLAEIIVAKTTDIKCIVAPHDLKRVAHLRTVFPTAVLYSHIEEGKVQSFANVRVLIIDCIGLLSRLYSYADIAVVGGGFHSKGLHNILEAATFGVPVFFGNQYKKNPEADELLAQQGGKCFEDEYFAAPYILELLKDDAKRKEMGARAAQFVLKQPYASEIIVNHMLQAEKAADNT